MLKNKVEIEEVIQILRYCIAGNCHKCPMHNMFCSEEVSMKYAIDILNKQKKEIVELEQKIADDILRLSEECGGGVLFYNKMRKYAEELRRDGGANEIYD